VGCGEGTASTVGRIVLGAALGAKVGAVGAGVGGGTGKLVLEMLLIRYCIVPVQEPEA
jgi:hypothetical protein